MRWPEMPLNALRDPLYRLCDLIRSTGSSAELCDARCLGEAPSGICSRRSAVYNTFSRSSPDLLLLFLFFYSVLVHRSSSPLAIFLAGGDDG